MSFVGFDEQLRIMSVRYQGIIGELEEALHSVRSTEHVNINRFITKICEALTQNFENHNQMIKNLVLNNDVILNLEKFVEMTDMYMAGLKAAIAEIHEALEGVMDSLPDDPNIDDTINNYKNDFIKHLNEKFRLFIHRLLDPEPSTAAASIIKYLKYKKEYLNLKN